MSPVMVYWLLGGGVLIGFALALFMPFYMSLWASLYLIYNDDPAQRGKVEAMKFEFSRVIERYQELFTFWQQQGHVDFSAFTLSLLLPPLIGAITSVLFGFLLIRYVRSQFEV